MIGAFTFAGVPSSAFKLVCRSVKRPLLPEAKTRRIEFPAASGAFGFKGCEYAIRQITMRIVYIGADYFELRTRARDIAKWLASASFEKLIFDDEPDKYYLAEVREEIELSSLWESGSAEVIFDCQPFAYSLEEQILTYNSGDYPASGLPWFTNPGTREINPNSPPGSKCVLKIEGSWNNLLFNSNWHDSNEGTNIYTSTPGSGVLEIDSVNTEITYNGVNWFKEFFNQGLGLVDKMFRILPGRNYILVVADGRATNVKVTLNYIPLWY